MSSINSLSISFTTEIYDENLDIPKVSLEVTKAKFWDLILLEPHSQCDANA